MTARHPQVTKSGRIGPLASLPLFHRLQGRPVVLAGSSEAALWKAELLAAAGADLRVFAPQFSAEFQALAADPPAGRVTLVPRNWQAADLNGAALALADCETADEARAFRQAAHAHAVLTNIIDQPDFCDFQFGTIVNRSPLVIGIATDGAAPVLAQAIRARIEAMLPSALANWAAAARDWRPGLAHLSKALRRRFWQGFAKLALENPATTPTEAMRRKLLDDAPATSGQVILMGAGPGDPELLTLKALRLLQSADVILHDDLVAPEVLQLARREATRIAVGKRGHGPSCDQAEICDLLITWAQAGKTVIRLKSGDPGIFGRATEEIDACVRAGILVSLVPGISAAQGAAASLGVSLTERRVARRLQFVTGHAQDGRLPADLCWPAMADPTASTVIYMPRATLAEFAQKAQAAGLPADTPAVAVMNASRTDEQQLWASISTLAEKLKGWPTTGPVLVMVGQAFARTYSTSGGK